MGVNNFNVMSLSKARLIDPEKIGYQDSIEIIHEELHKTRKSFIKIGWYLKHIHDNNMYDQEGYTNIYDFAMEKFRFSQSTTTRYINLCEEFSVNHNSPELDQKYEDYNISQLFEMLSMSKEKIEQVTPDMTVDKIREIKKPSSKAIKAFYVKYIMNTEFANNRGGLKQYLIDKFGKSNSGGAGSGLNYACSRKGIRLNDSSEITWASFVKSIDELIPVTASDCKEEDDIPGQTSIERNFPEYLPDDFHIMSHKSEQIIDGEYLEIEEENEVAQNDLSKIGMMQQGIGEDTKENIFHLLSTKINEKDIVAVTKYFYEEEKRILEEYIKKGGESEITMLRQETIVSALEIFVDYLNKQQMKN